MQYKLPSEWNLGFQVEVNRFKDQDEQVMHTEFLQTQTISHSIIKGMERIAETYYTYDFKAHQFDVARDFKLDVGLNFGIYSIQQQSIILLVPLTTFRKRHRKLLDVKVIDENISSQFRMTSNRKKLNIDFIL